ncbi:MAG: hypothetical protein ACYC0V_21705, partial [Armatimonadota bacterium]
MGGLKSYQRRAMTVPWYENENVRDKLMIFGRAIQGVGPFEVVIEPDPTKCHSGLCSFDSRRISVNPTLFKLPAIEQYQLTKALLVHEGGHRRHTAPTVLPDIVREIANILEDERVESRMWEEFVGVRWLIKKLAARFYQETTPIEKTSDRPDRVVCYFLQFRWAKRINQPIKGGLSPRNELLWKNVEPFVYES